MEKTEFEQMRDKALEQLMKGQSLTGKDGVFAPLLVSGPPTTCMLTAEYS